MKIAETGVLGPLPTYSVGDILRVDITICAVRQTPNASCLGLFSSF